MLPISSGAGARDGGGYDVIRSGSREDEDRLWDVRRALSPAIKKFGTLKFNVKDELKRTWARTTRSQHKDKGGEGPHTPQTGGKYAPK